jgi:glycosyltransferase involved in cell wall biosynthesis
MISGKGLVRKIKEFIYDIRHPAYCHWLNHLQASFGARLCIVHYPFQKRILENKGFKRQIEIIPHPVENVHLTAKQDFFSGNELELGSSGFINLNYDYNGLFSLLEKLEIPWRFTWIGGLRRNEDSVLLDSILSKVKSHGWEKQFTITGWVDENELNENLRKLDIYLALFSNRSTSSTLMKALAAECLIVARQLPLTVDLNSDTQIMLTVSENISEVIKSVNSLLTDSLLRERIWKNICAFKEKYSYENMANRHAKLYDQLL